MNIKQLPYTCLIFLLFSIYASFSTQAQVVYENPKHQVYEFLSRQAQKGNIDFDDLIQPVSRKQIAMHLSSLQDSIHKLSAIEQKELGFYQKEFSEFNDNMPDSTTFFKKDPVGRLRFLSVKKGDFILRGDPSFLFGLRSSGIGTSFIRGTGLQFWGHATKNISFQAYFQDFTESGKGIDSLRLFTPQTGIVRTEGSSNKTLNYSEFRGNVTYSWFNGAISIGQDQLLYGYGEGGKMVLSDKSPVYPFIRLDYRPLKWLSFNYSHAFLQSGLIDSARSYNKGNDIYGSTRESYIPKFMASHSLTFYPSRGLSLSIGESMVYSDKLKAGYLIPVMFFKVYDQYDSRYKINSGSNSQFFFQASSRNHLKHTHLYATLFIDEIRTAKIFNKNQSRNQVGFNAGASVTDFGIPYLSLGVEYSRINPFVYNNLIPAQKYSNQNYSLGDWMGANADRFLAYVKYTPVPKLKTTLQIQNTRKGDAGSLFDQYFAEPQPKFLAGPFKQALQVQFNASYEWLNNFYFDANAMWTDDKNLLFSNNKKLKQIQFSVRIGI